jgi:hypothetical protein
MSTHNRESSLRIEILGRDLSITISREAVEMARWLRYPFALANAKTLLDDLAR